MLIDARSLSEGALIEADIAIIGAGAVGIAMARSLRGQGLKVAVVESGGFEYDDATQALYAGETSGNPTAALDVGRLRYLGGTSNHWAGYCRPFEPIDFEARPWVPLSGWPLRRADLDPYYAKAHGVLELQAYDYRPERWAKDMAPLLREPFMQGGRLYAAVFQQSPPTRLGERYRDDLEKAPDVAVYLWANVVRIGLDAGAKRVEGLDLACLEGPRFRLRAKEYVLATGGIENARLLLASNDVAAGGVGNAADWVGRCFMDHPGYEAATLVLSAPSDLARAPASQIVDTAVALAPEVLRREKLLNPLFQLHPAALGAGEPEGYAAFRNLTKALRRGQVPDGWAGMLGDVVADLDGAVSGMWQRFMADITALEVRIHPEVAPNRDSRITLLDERDRLGLPRVHLHWQLSEIDRRTIRRGLEILGEEVGAAGLGRLQLHDWVQEANFDVPGDGSYHHCGTTRMSDDPKAGVVDRDCRVHGMENLSIAGSSVFPTCGYANPTLSLVALGLRLADHLKAKRA
ncbi:MAG: GMC family oxidoreductase [Geminicoccaceae bacterium]|nr:GMC family oxidoreductase [Geminicoccaceae bacterium]